MHGERNASFGLPLFLHTYLTMATMFVSKRALIKADIACSAHYTQSSDHRTAAIAHLIPRCCYNYQNGGTKEVMMLYLQR